MDDAYAQFQRALASALDQVRSFTPPSFEVNLVLRHKTDPGAHMIVGQSDVLVIRQAIDETLQSPGRIAMEGTAREGFVQLDEEAKT